VLLLESRAIGGQPVYPRSSSIRDQCLESEKYTSSHAEGERSVLPRAALPQQAVTPVRVSRTQKFIADDLTDMAFVITVDVRFVSTEKLAGEPGQHAWWWRCGSAALTDLSNRFAVDANANRTANLATGSRQNLKL
jgi:hypothetical protein